MSDLDKVSRPADRAILEQLNQHGDDLSSVRHTLVFFLRAEDDERDGELVFNPLAERLVAAGWSIYTLHGDGVSGEAQRRVDPVGINRISEEMEALAAEFGVVYDGWECAIVPGADK
ncbi:MAG TPA: ribonuclease E inhibitor RraB [Vitreimonas sp.]|uniref:ribonuclease E inhibitor RraB n=1 Tax=Vitreimonas sp. TaxID=3069702 RepID=UPI002D22BA62|nr:ribonuclease E inhibitor RraB [Vitreimonas sp.]HYD87893.1 ribonuclease E inhibitor RraB [Vitreimonas sp.]